MLTRSLIRPLTRPLTRGIVESEWDDPLSGLDLALRLQSHKSEQAYWPEHVEVSGAGVEESNGRYFLVGSQWEKQSPAYYFTDYGGLVNLRLTSNYEGGPGMVYEASGTIGVPVQPWDGNPYTALEPEFAPAPTVTHYLSGTVPMFLDSIPIYEPSYLYTDTGFTVPAVEDEQIGGWNWPGLPGVTQSNLTSQPTLRRINGVPVVDFVGSKAMIFDPIELTDFAAFALLKAPSHNNLLSDGEENFQLLRSTNENRLSFYDGSSEITSDPLSSPVDSFRVIGTSRVGSAVTFYEGSTPVGSGMASNPISIGFLGGLMFGSLQLPFSGDLIALVISRSGADAAVIAQYLETLKPPMA